MTDSTFQLPTSNCQLLSAMQLTGFIEMTGATLDRIISADELHHENLADAGVTDTTIVRVNRQGDIEVRRPEGWDIVGGLIGEFEARVRQETGLNWA